MKVSDVKDYAVLAAVAAGAYLLYRTFGVAKAGVQALANTGEAISSSLFDYFHPDAAGESFFYNTHFSNGNHMIPASTVDSAGNFTYNGAKFVMRTKVNDKGIREYWAFPP